MNYIDLQDGVGAWLMNVLGVQATLSYTDDPKPNLPYLHFYFTNIQTVGQDEQLPFTGNPLPGDTTSRLIRGLRSFITSVTMLSAVPGNASNRLTGLQDVLYQDDKMQELWDLGISVTEAKPIQEVPVLLNESVYQSKAVVDVKMNIAHIIDTQVYIISQVFIDGTIKKDSGEREFNFNIDGGN